jgi:hypothetical protein
LLWTLKAYIFAVRPTNSSNHFVLHLSEYILTELWQAVYVICRVVTGIKIFQHRLHVGIKVLSLNTLNVRVGVLIAKLYYIICNNYNIQMENLLKLQAHCILFIYSLLIEEKFQQ